MKNVNNSYYKMKQKIEFVVYSAIILHLACISSIEVPNLPMHSICMTLGFILQISETTGGLSNLESTYLDDTKYTKKTLQQWLKQVLAILLSIVGYFAIQQTTNINNSWHSTLGLFTIITMILTFVSEIITLIFLNSVIAYIRHFLLGINYICHTLSNLLITVTLVLGFLNLYLVQNVKFSIVYSILIFVLSFHNVYVPIKASLTHLLISWCLSIGKHAVQIFRRYLLIKN